MSAATPIAKPDIHSARRFARRAAKFSLFAPLFTFFISICIQPLLFRSGSGLIICGVVQLVLTLSGLGLGIFAVASTKRCGRRGIYWRAMVGACINGLLVLLLVIFIPLLMKLADKAKIRQQQRVETQGHP
jgi:hypothetical protein